MPHLVDALLDGPFVVAAEMRPPRAELDAGAGMDAWIDTYHAVRGLVRQGRYVLLTDSAVGWQEEDNVRHLVANLGGDVPPDHVVPFLTSKHTLEYCLSYADRASEAGFPALVVLGGDRSLDWPTATVNSFDMLSRGGYQKSPNITVGACNLTLATGSIALSHTALPSGKQEGSVSYTGVITMPTSP